MVLCSMVFVCELWFTQRCLCLWVLCDAVCVACSCLLVACVCDVLFLSMCVVLVMYYPLSCALCLSVSACLCVLSVNV